MTIKHASIVPLIGGQTLGQEKAMGSRPEWLASFEAFASNDSHAVNHYKDLPYYHLSVNLKASRDFPQPGHIFRLLTHSK